MTMEQVVNAVHHPQLRLKWDKNIESISLVKKVSRVQLIHTVNRQNQLESVKRDMFEKKFGFSYRPPVHEEEKGLSIHDQVTNFFFASSLDD